MRDKTKGARGQEGKRGRGEDHRLSPFAPFPLSPGRRSLPSISVLGAGRLGTALAIALRSRGYRIEALLARHLGNAKRAARLINPDALALSSAQFDRLPRSELFLITTPDDLIAEAASRLARAVAQNGRGLTALHASGALSSATLHSLKDAGFDTGSMHPLVSVSDALAGAEGLSSAFYCIEGDVKARQLARKLVRDLGGQSFSISARDKALYHAAAVIASGHTVALFDVATEMLVRCGLTGQRARSVLMPLLRSTVENLSAQEPAHAITGTFARADAATVERHLDALRSTGLHDALAVYVLLGERSLELAARAGARPGAVRKIAAALARAK